MREKGAPLTRMYLVSVYHAGLIQVFRGHILICLEG